MENAARELGFDPQDLTSLYKFLCDAPQIHLIVHHLDWSDSKVAGQRFSARSDIIDRAIKDVVSKSLYYTTEPFPAKEIRATFKPLDNDVFFVVKFVALQRQKVWSTRSDDEIPAMCEAAVGVLRAIQCRLLKSPITYDNNPLLMGLVRAAPRHKLMLDERFELPQHIKTVERRRMRATRTPVIRPANDIVIDLTGDD